jgi:imidazolonepropionase-like amidohydrolase
MHVHLSIITESSLEAFIANGVTGVRDMGGDLDQIDGWRKEIAAGVRIGPRIVRAGPLVDGPKKTAMYRLTVTNAVEAQHAVDSLQQRGVDFIKVHNRVPRDAYFALADECRKTGMRFVGHIPRGVSAEEATSAGQRSIEHTETLIEAAAYQQGSQVKSPEEALDTYTPERRAALFAKFVRNGTWYCPTLFEYRNFAFESDPSVLHDPREKYLARSAREYIERFSPAPAETTPVEQYAGRKAMFRRLMGLVAEMQRAGVGLLAGTDPPARGVYPGFGLHDELAILVEAGLTPMQALQTATRNPAAFLGELDSLGTVDEGKVADLVLLDGDPLEDIRNSTRIAAVIVAGRVIRKPELRAMLERVEESVRADLHSKPR